MWKIQYGCQIWNIYESQYKFHMDLKETNMTAKQEYLRGHRCEGTNMPYKCKLFEAVIEHLLGISILYRTDVCKISKVISTNK